VSVYGSEGMVKRHSAKVRKIKGLLRLVRKRVPFLHENPFLKNFSDFGDTLLVGTSIVGWFSTFTKNLRFLGFFFFFLKNTNGFSSGSGSRKNGSPESSSDPVLEKN
jgi:hypothetical protein